MPDVQPFRVARPVTDALGGAPDPDRLTAEIQDSFWLYGQWDGVWVWLTR